MVEFGPMGQLVYERTYSRVQTDGSLESYEDTVTRVVDGNLGFVSPKYIENGERHKLKELFQSFKDIPAGRHLWMTGVQGRSFINNCWVSHWDSDNPSRHFRFTLMRLMEGGGVGSNYSDIYLRELPSVQNDVRVQIVCDPEHPDYDSLREAGVLSFEFNCDWPGSYNVEDSREGWADALSELINVAYRDNVTHINRVFDVSQVRSAGSRIKTAGGTASGPVPLAQLMIATGDTLSGYKGQYLPGMAAMDIDHAIGQCVVAGGSRRSARMSMMRWDDPDIREFLRCKKDGQSHWTTNISVEVDGEFYRSYENGDLFATQVMNSVAKGMHHNGEPGIWNSELSNAGEPNQVVCTNPCLTGDTVIATVDGPRTFADLAESGEDVEVYSWHPETKTPVVRWMRNPHKTREQAEILKVTFDSGLVVRCTPDHSFYTFRGKKVQAKHLANRRNKSIRAFSASRDTSGHERIHGWDSQRNMANHQWTHRMVWENEHGPVPDGMEVAHLNRDAHDNRLDNLQVMTPYEHASYDYPPRRDAGFNGHCPNHKVISVESGGYADVYNGMVEDSHTYIVLDPDPIAGHMSGIVSANCGEIALEPWEQCNLGHVNLDALQAFQWDKTNPDIREAHRLMTRFLIRATFSDIEDSQSEEVRSRNRRIGVGHTGVAASLAKTNIPYSEAPHRFEVAEILDDLKNVVDSEARRYAHQLRIPVPVKTTTVAPTGTISKMPGTTEGIHPVYSRHFIRRIRLSKINDVECAMIRNYRDAGYTVEDDVYAANTAVIEIPTEDTLFNDVKEMVGAERARELVESYEDLSLYDLISFQQMYQQHWADNAVSFTANFDPGNTTVDSIVDTVRRFHVKGFTLFPEQSFEQAPMERMSEIEYNTSQTKQVSDSVDEDCANGACPVR